MPTQEEKPQQQQREESENEDQEEEENEDQEEKDEKEEEPPIESEYSSETSEDEAIGEDDYYVTDNEDEPLVYVRPGDEPPPSDNTAETNIRRFTRLLNSRTIREGLEEEERDNVTYEELYNFPPDPENWKEEDLKELWTDAPWNMTKPGWDPVWADEDDWDVVMEEIEEGRDPPIAPFFLPYRKYYPAIPDNHFDIANPKAAVEELDRIEEFLTWVSYIFADGSSYEGTVWDDLAHGKGVYIAEQGLVRYEGEWLQNDPDGHGVVEVDIPDIEPVPGSKLEAKMRAEGKLISRDFMSPEDREWLEMDIEDSIRLADGRYEIPFYENDEWIKQFGRKPEKGRYRYAGQWKLGRMHGCGLYEVNESPIYGRFYFGELLETTEGCDEETVTLHAGLAEVAAAKARMFVNKPDGMVREERGPYSDPQHPYFYEEEDVWMAPGFINQFYEVPDYWKTYVHEVDQEREIWLNSFYKSPFRIPMPAELEYWWQKEEPPEFILVNKEPEPDPEDPSKLIYTEDPLILHTPTGRLINYIEDEKYGIRLFWQPPLKEGEDIDSKEIEFLPLGFDEFYGKPPVEEKETMWQRIVMAIEKVLKPVLDKLENWTEEQKKVSELKMQLYEKELDLIEAELCLEEAIEDLDEDLKRREKEEEKKVETGFEEEDISALPRQAEEVIAEEKVGVSEDEDEDEEDEEEEEDNTPSSFGSVTGDQDPSKNDQTRRKSGESPFSSLSLSFASRSLVSLVPSRLQQSFLLWKEGRSQPKPTTPCDQGHNHQYVPVDTVHFPSVLNHKGSLKAMIQTHQKFQSTKRSNGRRSQGHSSPTIQSRPSAFGGPKRVVKAARAQTVSWLHAAPDWDIDNILSLHTPMCSLKLYTETSEC